MDTERILTIPRSSESLCIPVKSSTGLKYTSVAVTSSVVCLGTNTGSTYIFEKESLKLVKFISSKGGSIKILQFSKDNKFLAIVDSTGIVTCLEIREEKFDISVVKEIEDHKGGRITCLCWDDDSARLFIGDERGIVTAFIIAPFKLPAGKFLSKSTVEIVVKGESPIVQLDYSRLKLLVSTTTRTLLCLTDKSKYQQIGSKPRDGKFGSCFLQYADGEYPVIYAARPGSRLWEVDFYGQVLATHQFKYLLATPPRKINGLREKFFTTDEAWDKPQAIAFSKLIPFCKRYVVTWSHFGLYIMDPSLGKIAGWYDEMKGITDVYCQGETVYVIYNDGQVMELEFLSVKNCLRSLIAMSEYIQAAHVALQSKDEILKYVENFLTIDFEAIQERLLESEDPKAKELHEFLQDLITKLHSRHDQVRAEIQERLNRMPSLDEAATPCDSGVEDNEDVKSNQSDVISEGSSRLSLSRLPHVDVDRVLRRATNAVVNKIISSGFMKKALHEVLEEDSSHSASPLVKRSQLISRRSPVHIDPNRKPIELKNVKESLEHSSPIEKSVETSSNDMGNAEIKLLESAINENASIETLEKRQNGPLNRRRRKAKIVTVDFESPEKEDLFKTASYETTNRNHVRRLLSSDSANSYSPLADIKRLSSTPHNIDSLDIQTKPSSQSPPQLPTETHETQAFAHSNIIEKAKQLVRKVIHPETPPPFDVKTTNNSSIENQSYIAGRDSLACLLVSDSALKTIPKFVDITAVCRNKLRDSRVMFNSTNVKKILHDWAEKLSETVKQFSFAMADDIKKKNTKHVFTSAETDLLIVRTREEFFENLGAAFSEISNLAVLCYEAGIFPSSCSDLDYLEVRLIRNESSFKDVRRKVNEILNIDDSKTEIDDVDSKDAISSKSTLLSLAQSLDGHSDNEDKLFFINDESLENDEQKDVGAEDDDRTSVEDKNGNDSCLVGSENPTLHQNSHKEDQNVCDFPLKNEDSTDNASNMGGNVADIISKPDIDLQNEPDVKSNSSTHVVPLTTHESVSETHDQLHKIDVHSKTDKEHVNENNEQQMPPYGDFVNIAEIEKVHFFEKNLEWILCSSDEPSACNSCQEDLNRACFVLRFYPLLDLNKIRTVLDWKQGCRWRTWLAYLIHLEDKNISQELNNAIADNNFGKLARILHDTTNIEVFFSCFRRLLPTSSSLVFDICTEKQISPWEVSLIYLTNIKVFTTAEDFLGYITTIKRIRPSSNPVDDISVAVTIVYCSLRESSNSSNIMSYYCGCGAAREGAHLLPWKHKDFIDSVISNVIAKEDGHYKLVDRILDLCRRYGYWSGCIRILRHRQDHKHAFEIINQLGDFDVLDDYVKTETFSIHEDDLKHLCSLVYHTKNGPSKCEPALPDFVPTIDNESLARLLVRELGPKQALRILKCFKEEDFLLSSGFYYACMKIAEKEMEQRHLILRMMETLNNETYENKSTMQRQIEELKNKELAGELIESEISLKEDDPSSNEMQSSSSSNQWGVSLNLSNSSCPCCTLPLCIHGASASAGLIVFECGHVYHKQCIPEEACIICYYKLDDFV